MEDNSHKTFLVKRCQGHEEPREQRLKERFKSNFQTRNKTKLHDSKIITYKLKTITQDVQDNMKMDFYCANICKHEQGYGARSCLGLVLNKLKEMRGLISICFKDLAQGSFQGGFYVCIK